MSLSRRSFGLGSALCLARPLHASLRTPRGSSLRLAWPAPRRGGDAARALDMADAWPSALTHERLGAMGEGGVMTYPLTLSAPSVDRADPRVSTLTLRPGITFSDGVSVDSRAVLEAFRAASSGVLGRLSLAMGTLEARGPRELVVRTATPGILDEMLCAWPLAVVGARAAGLGAFRSQGDGTFFVPNPLCPTGSAYLDRVELQPARGRNDELRAFTTGALDASWRGNTLYDVRRPAELVRGSAAAVVGLCPTAGGVLDRDARYARALEVLLAPIAASAGSSLGPVGLSPSGAVADERGFIQSLSAALSARDPQRPVLRLARESLDGQLDWISERIVALLDAAGVRVALVSAGATEPSDATVRAIAPIGADSALAVASFIAAAGDEAHASEVVRSPRLTRGAAASRAWGRGTEVLLGRAIPTVYVRRGIHGLRFLPDGRMSLSDAWVSRTRP